MGVAWPATGEELRAAGYKAICWAECKSCGARIAWTRTPAGKRIPLEVTTGGEEPKRFQAHFVNCTAADTWRRSKADSASETKKNSGSTASLKPSITPWKDGGDDDRTSGIRMIQNIFRGEDHS